MTVAQIDKTCKFIQTADRSQLKQIRSILADMQRTGKIGYEELTTVNKDIRSRADWLRERR